MALHAYLPQDRLRALARSETLPEHCDGAALFADISGFTALTEALTLGAGQRRGVEELARRINAVHQALIEEVERCGGSVVGFAGDGMTCWFDAGTAEPTLRALHCAQRMQQAMRRFDDLSVKVGIGSGPAQRRVVGDPAVHLIDLLAGASVARAVMAESQARAGEVVVDAATVAALQLPTRDARAGDGEVFFAVDPALSNALPVPVLPTPAPVPRLDLETLRPWVLPFVFERETTGGDLFGTDLRPATALFLRLLPQDGTLAALADTVAQAQHMLQRHGGVLLEVTVDAVGICLYGNFGAAQVHEDDAARALRAALQLQAQLHGTAGAVQIGLSSGTLCVGGYGGSTRRSFGAIGDEVNSAARLMAKAQPGEILVSGRVRQMAGDGFAFEARPPMAVKGKAEPMPVFAFTGLQQRRAIRLQAPAALLPMVGREAETAVLAQGLAAARQGRGQMLRVVAEAGMGKSRLLAEGIRLARRAGYIGYGGACRMDGVRTPYLLWHGVWTAFFDLDPALPQRRQRQAVQAALQLHAPEHAEAWPLLGAVLGQDWPDNDFTAALQPQGRKALLEALLIGCLHSAAAEAAEDGVGLLLVLEDLHAADPLSLDLLLQVARCIATLPVLLLSAERPADSGGAAQGLESLGHVAVIELAGLGAADVEHIVRAKLALHFPERAGAVPRELIERIAVRAQGNPFFVEELLDYLHDRGIDPRRPEAGAALELPSSLHSLVLSRLDRLPVSQQHELKAASVIGREFAVRDLQGYCPTLGSAEVVRSDLQELDRLGFTPALADAPVPSHLFRHLVTHEVSYESIAHDTRVRLHAQYARHLEQQHGEHLAPLAAQLAHHYDRAACAEEASRYLRQAGEQAAAAFANEEALAFFARALQWLPGADAQARFDVLMQRQAVYDLQGRHELQRADLDELRRLALVLDDRIVRQARVATSRAKLDIVVGDYAAAEAGARAAVAAIEGDAAIAPRQAELLVDALSLQAQALYFAGQAAAGRPALERALALAQAHGFTRGEISALSHTGLLYWHAGDGDSAEQWLRRALELSQSTAHLRLQLDMLINLGLVAKSRGRLAQAMGHYEHAQRIARRIGDRSGEAVLWLNLGSLALASGAFHQAGVHSDQAASLFAQAHEPVQHALALINRAEAHRETGQYPQALALSTQALSLLRTSGFRRGEAVVLENLGLIALALGRFDDALQSTQAALDMAREIGLRGLEASALLHLGQIHLARGGHAEARSALAEAQALMSSLDADVPALELQAAQARLWLAEAGGAGHADAAARAAASLAPVLPRLQQPAPSDAVDAPLLPMSLYLAAWRVLDATGDAQAPALLARARQELHERSQRLPDATLRRDYLAVAEHRALLDAR